MLKKFSKKQIFFVVLTLIILASIFLIKFPFTRAQEGCSSGEIYIKECGKCISTNTPNGASCSSIIEGGVYWCGQCVCPPGTKDCNRTCKSTTGNCKLGQTYDPCEEKCVGKEAILLGPDQTQVLKEDKPLINISREGSTSDLIQIKHNSDTPIFTLNNNGQLILGDALKNPIDLQYDNENLIYGVISDASNQGSILKFQKKLNNYFQTLFVLTATGTVGIGTSTPSEKLTVNGAIQIQNTTAGEPNAELKLKSTSTLDHWGIYQDRGTGDLRFWNGDNRLIITKDGLLTVKRGNQIINFATGTNNSGYQLDIGVNDDGVNFVNNSLFRGFNFKNNNGTLLSIDQNGNVTIKTKITTPQLCLGTDCRTSWPQGGLSLWATSSANSNNIYYNAGNVGIGLTNPANTLDVNGTLKTSGTTTLATLSGNVGIGTQAPEAKLHIFNPSNTTGPLYLAKIVNENTSDNQYGLLINTKGNNSYALNVQLGSQSLLAVQKSGNNRYVRIISSSTDAGIGALRFDQGAANFFTMWTEGTGTAGSLYFGYDGTSATDNAKMVLKSTGNLGIGTTNPTEKLTVNGNISASGNVAASQDVLANRLLLTPNTGEAQINKIQAKVKILNITSAGDLYLNPEGGNVGIGTTAPEKLLHLKTSSGNAEIDIQSGSKPKWGIYHDEGSEQLRFWNGDNRLTITKDGYIGIGTINPKAKLDVPSAGNNLTDYTARFMSSPSTAGAGGILFDQGAPYGFKLHTENTGSADGGLLKYSYVYTPTGERTSYGNNILVLKGNGKVGIGTDSPQTMLDVRGVIRTGGGIAFPNGVTQVYSGPVAYARVIDNGSILYGTGNITSSWDNTIKAYRIQITDDTSPAVRFVANVTPVNTDPRIVTINTSGRDFIVKIYTLSGSSTSSDFNITIYKP